MFSQQEMSQQDHVSADIGKQLILSLTQNRSLEFCSASKDGSLRLTSVLSPHLHSPFSLHLPSGKMDGVGAGTGQAA